MISRTKTHANRRRQICQRRRDAGSSDTGGQSARRGPVSKRIAGAVQTPRSRTVSVRYPRATRYVQAPILAVSSEDQELIVLAVAKRREKAAPDCKRGDLKLWPADGWRHRDRASPSTALRRSKGRTRARTLGSSSAVVVPGRSEPDSRPWRPGPRSLSADPG